MGARSARNPLCGSSAPRAVGGSCVRVCVVCLVSSLQVVCRQLEEGEWDRLESGGIVYWGSVAESMRQADYIPPGRWSGHGTFARWRRPRLIFQSCVLFFSGGCKNLVISEKKVQV